MDNITEVELPVFLLSVLGFIINERTDNTKGRPTFEAWHTQSGPKSPWKYTATVDNSITRIIAVKTTSETIEAEVVDTVDTESSNTEVPKETATERINGKILASGKAVAEARSKNDLKEAARISAASIAKLGNGANITTDVLLKICEAMDCKLEDILETIKD